MSSSSAAASSDHLMSSTPIALLNPTTLTLAALSLLIIPALMLKPATVPFMQWLERKKYQYEVTIPLYMMTPAEKFVFRKFSLPFP
jgi:hypothetical protein